MPGVMKFHTLTRDKVPDEIHAPLVKLVSPHIDSFDFFLNHALPKAVTDLERREVSDANGRTISFWVSDIQIGKPMLAEKEVFSSDRYIYPAECRERHVSYKSKITVNIMYRMDGDDVVREETRVVGHMPIMVKSDRCNLRSLKPRQLIEKHEEPEELGGYFVINGNERIIRLLILPRRNYITGIHRGAFKNRGALYTPWGCSIRCVKEDQSAVSNTVHYLADGTCTFKFYIKKQEFLIPCIMVFKAIVDCTDKEIAEHLNPGNDSSFVADRVEAMLRDGIERGIRTRKECRAMLGKNFRVVSGLPARCTDDEVCDWLLRRYVFVHLDNNRDKFNLLVCMIRKLYRLVAGEARPDNPDAPAMQEVLLPGHLLAMMMKESLNELTDAIRINMDIHMRRGGEHNFTDPAFFLRMLGKLPDIGRKVEYLLATGNLKSPSGLDLQQASGFTIMADKLNWYRYLSHFRCIHRGAFFSEMKTTAVRKLLPEAFGFLCPVHTPDGAPCGLLNHLAHTCEIVNVVHETGHLPAVLVSLGMAPASAGVVYPAAWLPVILDGRIVGYIDGERAQEFAATLRYLKVTRQEDIPLSLEIAVLTKDASSLAPAVYLFATPARMARPVQYLPTGQTELIGSLEQVFLNIAVTREETYAETTHQELHPTNMLSVIANMTPFSDHNQSPRNMYQCQMGKQTMGTPLFSYPYRTDNKLYRIRTPQVPMVRTGLYEHYKMDNYPLGTNAVVAVISYTGYDMEDAMIINKGSEDRGFAHGTVYKCKPIELVDRRHGGSTKVFGLTEKERRRIGAKLDVDGFPRLGTKLQADDPLYAYIDQATGECKVEKYKDSEECYVEEVRLLGNDTGDAPAQRALIKLRVVRNPIIGDKFSSRHGQKGVCSKKWGMEDMPFTESGMAPDIIINPHAFPSRMTIGMLIESMAGKSGALNGNAYDATPFTFDEQQTAYAYFGEQLRASGYNYFGSERMYSGITGTELDVDIFIGVVYYQRLRHMVSDKFQVRTTGPVDPKTRQPVKGRKRHGGIRLGEMERDSLLAHGVSYLLQDRLFNCSDASYCCVCRGCGSILSPNLEAPSPVSKKRLWTCRVCDSRKHVETIAVPYVFRYLVAEMFAMNMRLTLEVK